MIIVRKYFQKEKTLKVQVFTGSSASLDSGMSLPGVDIHDYISLSLSGLDHFRKVISVYGRVR